MSWLNRAYAATLVAGAILFAGPELVPRPARKFETRDLGRAIRLDEAQWSAAEARLESGHPLAGDDATQLRVRDHEAMLLRERHVRDVQTGTLLLVTLASLGFLVLAAPRAIRLRMAAPPAGTVEVMGEQVVAIDPAALAVEMSRLAPSRNAAVEQLRLGPRLVCGYCGAPARWSVLGRVGKRSFTKRPPPGAKDVGVKLGAGWWFASLSPDPCRKCGSKDVVEG